MKHNIKRTVFVLLLLPVTTAFADMAAAAKIHANLGFLYLSKAWYPQAQREFMQALQEDKKLVSGWYGLAYYFEKAGNESLAEKYYQAALVVDPQSGEANNNYGVFLCKEKRYREALHYLHLAANTMNYAHAALAYRNEKLCEVK